MQITQELVDFLVPEHGRTSCSDEHLSNGHYDITEESLKGVVIRRNFVAPRCNRCFLLECIRYDDGVLPRGITLRLQLDAIQPAFDIVQKS